MEPTYPMQSGGPEAAFGIATILCMFVFILFFVIIIMWAYCKIFAKAGYPWALPLLILIPFVGQIIALVLLLYLAFSDWPILKQLRALQQSQSNSPQMGGPQKENFRTL